MIKNLAFSMLGLWLAAWIICGMVFVAAKARKFI